MITLIRRQSLEETDATLDLAAQAFDRPESVLPRAYGEADDAWAFRAALAVMTNPEATR